MSKQGKSFSFFGSELFFTGLTLIFIYLKLTNQIDWSWWWVLSPIWIPLAVVGVFIVVALILYLIFGSKG